MKNYRGYALIIPMPRSGMNGTMSSLFVVMGYHGEDLIRTISIFVPNADGNLQRGRSRLMKDRRVLVDTDDDCFMCHGSGGYAKLDPYGHEYVAGPCIFCLGSGKRLEWRSLKDLWREEQTDDEG